MIIKKRRTPENSIEEAVHPSWRMALHHPILASIVNFPVTAGNQSVEAGHLLSVALQCKRGALTQAPMQEKLFMYLLCFILWRTFGKSLLTDVEYAGLARHLFGIVIKDKIDQGGAVPLAHRLAFIYDIPEIGKVFRKANSLPQPKPPKPKVVAKPKLYRVKPKK